MAVVGVEVVDGVDSVGEAEVVAAAFVAVVVEEAEEEEGDFVEVAAEALEVFILRKFIVIFYPKP